MKTKINTLLLYILMYFILTNHQMFDTFYNNDNVSIYKKKKN